MRSLDVQSIFSLLLLAAFSAGCISTQAVVLPTQTSPPVATAPATIEWVPPTATSTQQPTAVLSPTPDLRPGVAELILDDDFSDEQMWRSSQSDSASAILANNRLTLATDLPNGLLLTTRPEPAFGDFYAELSVSPSLCSGVDEYGFVVRASATGDHYRFALSCDGRAKVERIYNGASSLQAQWVENPLIPSRAPSNIRLGVWASGSDLRFFINDFYLFEVRDTVVYRGTLGVFARSRGQGALSVSFSDLQVWALEE